MNQSRKPIQISKRDQQVLAVLRGAAYPLSVREISRAIFKYNAIRNSVPTRASLNRLLRLGMVDRLYAGNVGFWIVPKRVEMAEIAKSPDPVIEQLVDELRRRSEYGLKKYGVPLSREDLTLKDWLKLALEETLDKAGYLQCAINKLEKS